MPKLSKLFPSKYLKASDLKKPVELSISRVAIEAMQDGAQKPVAYFENAAKGIVLNKTNATMVAQLAKSDDTDHWGGVLPVLISDKDSSPYSTLTRTRKVAGRMAETS
jgi:hypothetical protein